MCPDQCLSVVLSATVRTTHFEFTRLILTRCNWQYVRNNVHASFGFSLGAVSTNPGRLSSISQSQSPPGICNLIQFSPQALPQTSYFNPHAQHNTTQRSETTCYPNKHCRSVHWIIQYRERIAGLVTNTNEYSTARFRWKVL